ncbi:MAG: 3-isopropylmalate dehydratase large subunit [Promethearchaeota archaeon]
MSKTIAEKILEAHSSSKNVVPGDFIEAKVDLIMVHEQLGGRIHEEFKKLELDSVWDPDKIFFILDHWVPPPSISAAKMHQICNSFSRKYKFTHDIGMNKGICHQVLPELGFARPGMLIVGSDSHTTTYGAFNCLSTGIGATDVSIVFATGKLWFKVPESFKVNLTGNLNKGVMSKDFILTFIKDISTKGAIYKSVEFHGDGANGLSIDSRMTISNMIVEAGAKFGVFLPDEKMLSWLKNRTDKKFRLIYPDENAAYEKEFNYNLSKIIPVVAKPSSPDNVVPITEVLGQEIDQAFLGSCTNGRMEDLRIAARILAKNKVNRNVKLIITPASTEIYLKALKEGLIELFIKAGAIVTHSTCGACIGGHLGVLGPNEICISSTNRNFIGRMGDSTSKIYLASPASVAASAIEGRITDPRDYV